MRLCGFSTAKQQCPATNEDRNESKYDSAAEDIWREPDLPSRLIEAEEECTKSQHRPPSCNRQHDSDQESLFVVGFGHRVSLHWV